MVVCSPSYYLWKGLLLQMHLSLVVCNRTLQSAAFMISLVVIPVLAAADAAMLWVECALNILVSIPALANHLWSNKDFSHLARVYGLCGLTTARNNLVCSSFSPVRKGSVLRSYARRVCCGQSLELLGKQWRT